MDQLSFSYAEYDRKRNQTRWKKFLQKMNQVIPWLRLEVKIRPSIQKR